MPPTKAPHQHWGSRHRSVGRDSRRKSRLKRRLLSTTTAGDRTDQNQRHENLTLRPARERSQGHLRCNSIQHDVARNDWPNGRQRSMVVAYATCSQTHAQAQDPQSSRQAVQSNWHWQVYASQGLPQSPSRPQIAKAETSSQDESSC